jgi:hypothetical protein
MLKNINPNFDKTYYGKLLNNLEIKFEKKNEIYDGFKKQYEKFCYLLFTYRTKFEKEKIQEMLERNNSWKYYANIISQNLQFFFRCKINNIKRFS